MVEGDGLKQQQEEAVRVTATGTGCLQQSRVIQPRTLSAGRNKQFTHNMMASSPA